MPQPNVTDSTERWLPSHPKRNKVESLGMGKTPQSTAVDLKYVLTFWKCVPVLLAMDRGAVMSICVLFQSENRAGHRGKEFSLSDSFVFLTPL